LQRDFPRNVGALAEIFLFVEESLRAEGIEPKPDLKFWLDLIVEELFTNLVKYGGDSDRDIAIRVSREGSSLVIGVTGFETEEFDITRMPPVDTDAPLARRRAGGLGLHLVRKIADEVSYEYADRTTTITVRKRLEDTGA